MPLGLLLAAARALAAEMPRVDPDGATAKSLNYTHASPDADKRCANCQFYTDPGRSDWGPCVIFPGQLVNADGLCNSYFKRAGRTAASTRRAFGEFDGRIGTCRRSAVS